MFSRYSLTIHGTHESPYKLRINLFSCRKYRLSFLLYCCSRRHAAVSPTRRAELQTNSFEAEINLFLRIDDYLDSDPVVVGYPFCAGRRCACAGARAQGRPALLVRGCLDAAASRRGWRGRPVDGLGGVGVGEGESGRQEQQRPGCGFVADGRPGSVRRLTSKW